MCRRKSLEGHVLGFFGTISFRPPQKLRVWCTRSVKLISEFTTPAPPTPNASEGVVTQSHIWYYGLDCFCNLFDKINNPTVSFKVHGQKIPKWNSGILVYIIPLAILLSMIMTVQEQKHYEFLKNWVLRGFPSCSYTPMEKKRYINVSK